MKDIGVDIMGLVDFADLIFEDQGVAGTDEEAQEVRISFNDFLKHVLQLRGSNTATVKDMVDLRWWLSQSLQSKLDAAVDKTMLKNQPFVGRVHSAPI